MNLVQNLKTTLWSAFGGNTPRDGPLENLSGGGGGGGRGRESTKKVFAQGKIE